MLSNRISIKAGGLEKYINYDRSSLTAIIAESEKLAKSWSGSFLGYHSRVYYRNFITPPAGANFSVEWGLYSDFDIVGLGSVGDWAEYDFEKVVAYIYKQAGSLDLSETQSMSLEASEVFEDTKASVLSIIHSQKDLIDDTYLVKLADELEKIKLHNARDYLKVFLKSGQIMTRDAKVEHKVYTPPHLHVLTTMLELADPFLKSNDLKKSILKISEYLENLEYKMAKESRIGTHVFIGHGRSSHWRDLKDFINERLNLPWDEFNRVPVAGLTNVTRLAQMLDQSAIAFLIMSAEDEQNDGSFHARMNVIHEVGLFQGRLGFERAIVLLEEGCEEFTNIQGLGQIRYPKGNISAVFEDIRQVLERENII